MTMMLGRTAASRALRPPRLAVPRQQPQPRVAVAPRRFMGGGGHYMHVDEGHRAWGEAFGVVCWLWVFHRARHDLPVFLGLRHPWEHAEDPFAAPHHVHAAAVGDVFEAKTDRLAAWDKFSTKALAQSDDDDDDDDEEAEDDVGDEEED